MLLPPPFGVFGDVCTMRDHSTSILLRTKSRVCVCLLKRASLEIDWSCPDPSSNNISSAQTVAKNQKERIHQCPLLEIGKGKRQRQFRRLLCVCLMSELRFPQVCSHTHQFNGRRSNRERGSQYLLRDSVLAVNGANTHVLNNCTDG